MGTTALQRQVDLFRFLGGLHSKLTFFYFSYIGLWLPR